MLNEPVTVRWLLNGVQKSTDIPANSHKMFYFYTTDNTKYIGLSAVVKSSGRPIPLNGYKVYQLNVDQGSDGQPDVDGQTDADSRRPPTIAIQSIFMRFFNKHFSRPEFLHMPFFYGPTILTLSK
jgi:hypothetical protein